MTAPSCNINNNTSENNSSTSVTQQQTLDDSLQAVSTPRLNDYRIIRLPDDTNGYFSVEKYSNKHYSDVLQNPDDIMTPCREAITLRFEELDKLWLDSIAFGGNENFIFVVTRFINRGNYAIEINLSQDKASQENYVKEVCGKALDQLIDVVKAESVE